MTPEEKAWLVDVLSDPAIRAMGLVAVKLKLNMTTLFITSAFHLGYMIFVVIVSVVVLNLLERPARRTIRGAFSTVEAGSAHSVHVHADQVGKLG